MFGPERFAGYTVQPFIILLVDVPLLPDFLEQGLDGLFVFRAGSTDEGSIADPQHLPQFLEISYNLIGVFDGLHPEGFRFPLDLQAVFVTAGDELDIKAVGPFVPSDGVGNGGAVGMSDVQVGAGIVNGRRNIKSRFRHGHSPLTKK